MRITQGASLHANWVSGGDSGALCNVRGASDSFDKMNIRPGSIWHKLGPKLSSNYFSFLAFGITRGRADNRVFDQFVRTSVFMKQFAKSFANLEKNMDGWVQPSA